MGFLPIRVPSCDGVMLYYGENTKEILLVNGIIIMDFCKEEQINLRQLIDFFPVPFEGKEIQHYYEHLY